MFKKNKSPEDEFYEELDKKKIGQSCCTWQAMLLFFGGLLVAAAILTVYLFYQVKQLNFSFRKIYPSQISKTRFGEKLQLNPKEATEFSIVLTSEELTAIAAGGINSLLMEVKEVQMEIFPEKILVSGRLIKPLKADLQIETVPEISEGKIKLKTQKITAGKLVLPGFLSKEIEKTLNGFIDGKFAPLYKNYQVEEIELEKDKMTISGRLKK